MINRAQAVRTIVMAIPRGRVATYGQIAALAGMKGARAIGTILHGNQDPVQLPCHRVVNARGRVAASYAFGGANAQYQRLVKEGVLFKPDPGQAIPAVDLERCQFQPAASQKSIHKARPSRSSSGQVRSSV
ncbi:MAG: hypothetical protein RL141_716 [Candidatus Parcubacteria bacterium]|jgi:methylated-DNA-protein-cysteine methyltransferase-like protein